MVPMNNAPKIPGVVRLMRAMTARDLFIAHNGGRPVVTLQQNMDADRHPLDTGVMHGCELPDGNPAGPYYRYRRTCSCGAIVTGFPHPWHGSHCPRHSRNARGDR